MFSSFLKKMQKLLLLNLEFHVLPFHLMKKVMFLAEHESNLSRVLAQVPLQLLPCLVCGAGLDHLLERWPQATSGWAMLPPEGSPN